MVAVISLDLLQNSFLFKEASETVLKAVAQRCEVMELDAGETLFAQDSEPDAMYYLIDGQVHVVRHYPDGYDVTLATEVPFYVIGELSLLANQPRTGSVVAVGDCDLIRLSRKDVLEICEAYPEVATRALNHLGNRLYRLNLQVRESAVGNVSARIASVLLMLATDEKGVIENEVNVTRLARATAMDADVVERILRQWDKHDVISVDKQRITIKNRDALQTFAG